MLNGIIAINKTNTIGNDNKLVWHNPNDLQFFKYMTLGKVILMGRKTFEGIGKVLPNRCNVILTSAKLSDQEKQMFSRKGINFVNSIDEFLSKYNKYDPFIIGGKSLYEQLKDKIDVFYVSRINNDKDGNIKLDIDSLLQGFDLRISKHVGDTSFEAYTRHNEDLSKFIDYKRDMYLYES